MILLIKKPKVLNRYSSTHNKEQQLYKKVLTIIIRGMQLKTTKRHHPGSNEHHQKRNKAKREKTERCCPREGDKKILYAVLL